MPGGYDPRYFAATFEVEDRHFWFGARNQALESVIRPLAARLPTKYRVLDVGCGTGKTLQALEAACPDAGIIVGMDLFLEALRYARRRTRVPLIQCNIQDTPFVERFDLVGMFDVLEHLEDDLAMLHRVRSLISPGRYLVLTVPAHMALWSQFDEESQHCRRYEPEELRARLSEAGFEIEYLTLFMATLYPIVRVARGAAEIVRRIRRGLGRPQKSAVLEDIRVRPLLNDLIRFALRQEARLLGQRPQTRLGTSLLAIAKAPA